MTVDRAVSILARFNAAQKALVSQFRELTPGCGEHQPSNTEWSAAQIVCHVAMANEWAAGVLTGATSLAQPAPAGFTERFGPIDVPRQKTFPLPAPAVIGQRSPHVEGDRDADAGARRRVLRRAAIRDHFALRVGGPHGRARRPAHGTGGEGAHGSIRHANPKDWRGSCISVRFSRI
jgi:hypothetical protein